MQSVLGLPILADRAPTKEDAQQYAEVLGQFNSFWFYCSESGERLSFASIHAGHHMDPDDEGEDEVEVWALAVLMEPEYWGGGDIGGYQEYFLTFRADGQVRLAKPYEVDQMMTYEAAAEYMFKFALKHLADRWMKVFGPQYKRLPENS